MMIRGLALALLVFGLAGSGRLLAQGACDVELLPSLPDVSLVSAAAWSAPRKVAIGLS